MFIAAALIIAPTIRTQSLQEAWIISYEVKYFVPSITISLLFLHFFFANAHVTHLPSDCDFSSGVH